MLTQLLFQILDWIFGFITMALLARVLMPWVRAPFRNPAGHAVIALTDWEFTHLGDPMEDWAYLVAMRGSRTMSRDAWLALFDRVAGVQVTERDLRYWTAFNFFKGACANLTCRRVFATVNPAPNMGLIGTALHQSFVRRLAEIIQPA